MELPPKPFALLCHLVRNPQQLVTKDALLDAVWGHRHVSESVLKTAINLLRTQLGDDSKAPRYIETVSRRGYRFVAVVAPVRMSDHSGASASTRAGAEHIIVRDEITQRLQQLWREAQSGRRQLVLLAGEPGVGKSTVVEAFTATIDPERVVTGQCVEQYGSGEPYLPLLEALNVLCARDKRLVEVLRQIAPTWLLQLPWHRGDIDHGALLREVSGATQDRMLREMGALLDHLTASRPLLLVLEDLHWSDTATVQLLDHLARRRTAAPLMLLGTFRPADVIIHDHPLGNLRRELRLHHLCEEISLDGFSAEEVAAYVQLRLGGEVDREFVRALHRHTDGLPLFVSSVVNELLDQQVLHRDSSGQWSVPAAATSGLPVPDNLGGVIEKQILRLPGEVRRILEAASLAAGEFDLHAVAAALELDSRDVQERLDGLVRRNIWLRSAGVHELSDQALSVRYAFRHALFRHVFAGRVGLAARIELHRRLAAALERLYGSQVSEIAAELAMHFERGRVPQRAVDYLSIAAENAQRGFALRDALELVQRGLQLLPQCPPGAARIEAETRLCAAQGAMLVALEGFASPRVGAAYERAMALSEELPNDSTRLRVLHGLWWFHSSSGDFAKARTLAERMHALAFAGDSAPMRIVAGNTLGMTLAHIGEMRLAQQHLEESLSAYRRVGAEISPELFIMEPGLEALCYLSLPLWWQAHYERNRQRGAELAALNARIRHPLSNVLTLFMTAMEEERREAPARVRQLAEQSLTLLDENAMMLGRAWQLVMHGWALAAEGEYDRGVDELTRGIAIQRSVGMLIGVTYFLYLLADAHVRHAHHAAAADTIDEAVALAEQTGEHMQLSPLWRLRGDVHLAHQAPADAQQAFRKAVQIAREQGALYYELAALLALCSRASASLADAKSLETVLTRVEPDDDSPVVVAARRWLANRG